MGKVKETVIIGHLCNNPVEKNGLAVLMLSNYKYGTTKIFVSGKQKEIVMKNLKRGDLCCIEGELVTLNKNVSIHAKRITFLSSYIGRTKND